MITKNKLLALEFIFLLMGCNMEADCPENIIENKINQDNLSQIPYKGGEKLTFFNKGKGDTIHYDLDTGWTNYYNSSFGGADCPIENRYEGRGIALKATKMGYDIFINQNKMESGTTFELDFKKTHIKTDYLGDWPVLDSFIFNGKVLYDVGFYSDDNNPRSRNFGCYFSRTIGLLYLYNDNNDTLILVE